MRFKDSGDYNSPGKMSKRGSKYLRSAVYQVATIASNLVKEPMFRRVYEKQKALEKHHKVAISHVANKMLHVIFAVLRDEKPFCSNCQKMPDGRLNL